MHFLPPFIQLFQNIRVLSIPLVILYWSWQGRRSFSSPYISNSFFGVNIAKLMRKYLQLKFREVSRSLLPMSSCSRNTLKVSNMEENRDGDNKTVKVGEENCFSVVLHKRWATNLDMDDVLGGNNAQSLSNGTHKDIAGHGINPAYVSNWLEKIGRIYRWFFFSPTGCGVCPTVLKL